jgi:GNAT superfamily N-acetyltransferase
VTAEPRPRITDALPADIEALRELFRRSSLSNSGDRANLLANPDVLWLSDRSVQQGRTRVAIGTDGRIVGFATSLVAGDALELEDLFVDPDWMSRGVGRALVLDVVGTARRLGLARLEVIANRHALGFYEKAGFVVDRDVETRFGLAPRMHLEVSPDLE